MNTNNVFLDFNKLDFSPEFAYILGFLWADGWVDNSGFHNKVKTEIKSTDAQELWPVFRKTGLWYKTERQREGMSKMTTIRISSKEFVRLLVDNDYKSKSSSPDKIISLLDKNLRPFWFRGLVDGDGCICVYDAGKGRMLSNITIAGPYEQDWSFIKKLCGELSINYNVSLRINKGPKGGRGSLFIISRKKDVITFGNWLYSAKNEMSLSRKRAKFNQAKELFDNFKRKEPKANPIRQINRQTNKTIHVWRNCWTASKELGIDNSQICKAAKHIKGHLSAGGFKWECGE